MASGEFEGRLVAVVGAGPAGIYAARELANQGMQVALFNRDIKPGGLAEYGIYHDKFKMKDGLRKQFRQILSLPNIRYYGNTPVGDYCDLTLPRLLEMGFEAVLVTAGAQGTKWLGLPGEEYSGVYHAKDVVYHYNKLPPFATQEFRVLKRVVIVGVGNVMMDIAHWCIHDLKVDQVIAVARRGPAEVKFSKKEMEYVIGALDVPALDSELARCAANMQAVGQDVQAARDYILSAMPKAMPIDASTRLSFDFLASPTAIIGDESGDVIGLEVEDTQLVCKGDDTKAVGLGTRRVVDADAIVFCIGDKVDAAFGLPVQWNAFVKHPDPAFPVDGVSYEAYDPKKQQAIRGVFVAGWSREASNGLVGVARKDGENGARAVTAYLATQAPSVNPDAVWTRLQDVTRCTRVVTRDEVARLEAYEQAEAQRRGLNEFKLNTNAEMLVIIDDGPPPPLPDCEQT